MASFRAAGCHPTPLAAHAVRRLPDLSATQLEGCRRSKGLPLSSCLLLSNPASGSSSLANAFRYEPALQNISFPYAGRTLLRGRVFPSASGNNGFDLMHTHALGVDEIQAYLRYKRLPEARCFVLPLRDPATRLMSGFRDSYVHAERMTVALGVRKNRTAHELIERLRRFREFPQRPLTYHLGTDGKHGECMAAGPDASNRVRSRLSGMSMRTQENVSAAGFLYAHSAGRPRWLYNWHYPGPVNGSMFLTSQLHYLRGVDCTTSEVHFVCQERFNEDWTSFFHGKMGMRAAPKLWHTHQRNESRDPMMRFAIRRAVLGETDQAFIRNALYPWDAALHRWACGSAARKF
mmetsp:Transcript_3441/g.9211  ORF Transcript_3441/g.9211 Transcript_3441/m.9211 type:complete len:348 (+) Transcript_3441:27-1070(+)|eukprot:CAMPEP_0115872878 /NCGR_PEP_ID=MMETSP0287-20121206/23673_1 /TAXON_ID=412157 /ORGANISM="Chrysochromulina rotalis, Strain UIO044" /LENGTH=347 /DNA_ID=CAMNT_0003327853 /DNA_START=18 /DNA_END=1061 /DNA_ORIENTATION=+